MRLLEKLAIGIVKGIIIVFINLFFFIFILIPIKIIEGILTAITGRRKVLYKHSYIKNPFR